MTYHIVEIPVCVSIEHKEKSQSGKNCVIIG